ncbi:MAG: sodium:alanine symporter family protein [Ruminococcaceae bacterium]|nr:sodium:alanine symporter family protein [Oscillospiraceae bacterium]
MLFESINSALSGYILPAILLIAGVYLGRRIKFFYILNPVKLFRDIRNSAKNGGVSPIRALSVALAGTLGVGNITGVATAIACGGAGAIFWMWICALLVMSVKYAEVYLSQIYRQPDGHGGHVGGAMYYMNKGLRMITGSRFPSVLAAAFAILIAANSLLTGSIVQVNAATGVMSSFFPSVTPLICGISFAVLATVTAAGGLKRVSGLTVKLVPFLSVVYIFVSLICIIRSSEAIPHAFRAIFDGAFSTSAAGGGVLGFGINNALRYGVARGIFSNEAGCGTAPSAHATANAQSAHHQGCMGIFEVFADTIVLCTVTALVILTSGLNPSEDGMISALAAFSVSGGDIAVTAVGISVILFAFATVICQSYYGLGAVEYLTPSRSARSVYIILLAISAVVGSVISSGVMWGIADFIIVAMTVINTVAVTAISTKITFRTTTISKNRII